ncbi:MAG: AmmeMemoRadiSam system protein B [Candidatus Omnitrophica bacterium]|nr:AmmeMemoRadiSam system protein B [Candidatus Omnitrophota bacterium]
MIRIFTVILFVTFSFFPMAHADTKIKRPNVSGQFYTAEPRELSAQIGEFFQRADVTPADRHIDIVIAPHAGYMYSGAVAAYGFKAASRNKYTTVVILAPSHYSGFDGISVGQQDGFQTPLGIVNVDQEFAKQLIAENEKFYFAPEPFEREHSLEVEIPFLQKIFTNFKIVPVIMGQPGFVLLEKFAASLNKIIGERKDVLIVVSTDLSHYHPDVKARTMDALAIKAITSFDAKAVWEGCQRRSAMEMCGFVPTTAALLYARQRGLTHAQMLRYANSGDVTGDRNSVVGYTSIIIYGDAQKDEDKDALTPAQKKRLLDIARQTMDEYVRTGKTLEFLETDPRLLREEGAFATIHKQGRLRGCIGNILGRGPLCQTVRDMAIAAAAKDPRFDPVQAQELKDLDIEVSVLSKPRTIKNADEIILGKHGVIVSQGPGHQGVFLPQVATETGWSKEEFLNQLCAQKAGLAPDAWKDPKTKIEIFTAQVFGEKDVQ